MKGGLAAAIVAVEAFLALRPDFPGAIEISATADEETGGYGGVAHLAAAGHFARVDHVIIPEPLNKDRVCLGHRGVWWAELETFGRIAHGSMPFLGDCAVRHMAAVIAEMEASLWPALAARRTAMPVVPPAARASTLNVNSLHGGQAEIEGFDGWPAPVVPDRCRMVIDRRFLMEEAIGEVKAEFRATVERARDGPGLPLRAPRPLRGPAGDDRPRRAGRRGGGAGGRGGARARGRVRGLARAPTTRSTSTGSAGCRNCVAYGPGILDLAHQPDEYVGVDDMVDAATVMGLALADLLGA